MQVGIAERRPLEIMYPDAMVVARDAVVAIRVEPEIDAAIANCGCKSIHSP